MRGPHDEQIVTAYTPETADMAVAAQRTPGGKPLLRLLQLLEARGYEHVAEATIETAVPEESREVFYARVEQHTSSPTRQVAGRRKAPATSPVRCCVKSAPNHCSDTPCIGKVRPPFGP